MASYELGFWILAGLALLCTTLGSQTIEEELNIALKENRVAVYDVSVLDRGRKTQPPASDRRLHVYCYRGTAKRDLWRIWTSYTLKLIMPTEYYVVYLANNVTEVYRLHKEATASWLSRFMPWRTDNVPLAVFNHTCVGIDTMESYSVLLVQKAIDPWLVGYLLAGLVLFFYADRLSRNVMFYYGAGIGFGLLASLLILVFILSRLMPKKYGVWAILVGGWSLTLWFLQHVWTNIQSILEHYKEYVAAYFIVTAVITFAIMYYKGPVSNPRLLTLIKWALQIMAMILIYNGTTIPEVSATVVVLLLLIHLIPRPSLRTTVPSIGFKYTFWWRLMPRLAPKPCLLTEDEYIRQGEEETRKALEALREYCRSPDCDAWKTMSRLSSPQKFASFIEGQSHISDEELNSFNYEQPFLNLDESDASE